MTRLFRWLAANELVVYAAELAAVMILSLGLEDGAWDHGDLVVSVVIVGYALMALGGLYTVVIGDPDPEDNPEECRRGIRWMKVGCLGMAVLIAVFVLTAIGGLL